MAQTTTELTGGEVAERVLQLVREDRRDDKRTDVEEEIIPGVRVNPAPLTYKGASVEVDTEHICPDEGDDLQIAVIQAYSGADDIDCFSSGTLWDEGYWYAALKDTERTGGRR